MKKYRIYKSFLKVLCYLEALTIAARCHFNQHRKDFQNFIYHLEPAIIAADCHFNQR